MWYEIIVNDIKVATVYDTQDIIRVSCDLIYDRGIAEEDIIIITHGKEKD